MKLPKTYSLDCGCRVEVRDDGLHVFPHSRVHQALVEEAARILANELAIPCEVVDA